MVGDAFLFLVVSIPVVAFLVILVLGVYAPIRYGVGKEKLRSLEPVLLVVVGVVLHLAFDYWGVGDGWLTALVDLLMIILILGVSLKLYRDFRGRKRPKHGDQQEQGAVEVRVDVEAAGGQRPSGRDMVSDKARRYPSIPRRYLATTIDWVFLMCGFIVLSLVLPSILPEGDKSTVWMRVSVLVGFLFLYEPLLTSLLCTIGQFLVGIRVRRSGTYERISVPHAYLRLIVKYFAGTVSLLTMPFTRGRKGIHDLAAGSVVVSAWFVEGEQEEGEMEGEPNGEPDGEREAEREEEREGEREEERIEERKDETEGT
jgi:uncharacterized RDD family membrane protein YckC